MDKIVRIFSQNKAKKQDFYNTLTAKSSFAIKDESVTIMLYDYDIAYR